MAKVIIFTHDVRSTILASAGNKAVIQLEDPRNLRTIHIEDNREGLTHPAQKTSEALTTYLKGDVEGLQAKYGIDKVRYF
jgi:hypothetical protein